MARTETVKVPDIGDFEDVDVVEVLIAEGDRVDEGDPLITLESDKASLDVPSPMAGTVKEILVAVNDKVSEGSPIAKLEVEDEGEEGEAEEEPEETEEEPEKKVKGEEKAQEKKAKEEKRAEKKLEHEETEPPPPPPEPAEEEGARPHASPSVRRFARELGVDLAEVEASGRKGRILKDDVKDHVREAFSSERGEAAGPGVGAGLPEVPEVDFAKFGEVEEQPLTKIKKLTAEAMRRAWLNAPQVTQFDEADVTDLEAFRQEHKAGAKEQGFNLTPLAFVIPACVRALREFPRFNSSLDPSGEKLIVKKYINLGIAVDTPKGLVVPVLRDADRKGAFELARELAELSQRAREGKSRLDEFQGATFSISSQGGIGGTNFTPIVNVPEVAILGISRTEQRPVWRDGEFVPRLIMPLALTYDHRVIDGAEAVRFTTYLREILSDVRKILL